MDTSVLMQLKAYFAALDVHQATLNKDLVMTFDRGYWWCKSDVQLQKYEKDFLKKAKNFEALEQGLTATQNVRDTALAVHLLGWSEEHGRVGVLLEKLATKEDGIIMNAALRALFPKVATGRYAIPMSTVHRALHNRSLSVKNKALGMLVSVSDTVLESLLDDSDREYVHQLTSHRDKPRVAILAQMLNDRICITERTHASTEQGT